MSTSDITLRVGGESGEGVISVGEMLTLVASRMGNNVYTFRTFPAEIKGGHAMYQVHISPEEVYSHGSLIDILVCFNDEAYEKHSGELADNAVVLHEASVKIPEKRPGIQYYSIPAQDIATREVKNLKVKNVVFLGALCSLFGFDRSILTGIIRGKFKSKGDSVIESNVKALNFIDEYIKKNIQKSDPFMLKGVEVKEPKVLMSGNQAVALAALAAGCRFYAGYPITPATDIMEYLTPVLPRFGGSMIQAEDEIAAIGMVMGASFNGTKAMTATSGPGFSLMQEFLGLSSMCELPMVIVDVQRCGPSTGMPTKTEQADLAQALYGTHGESPRIVIAPSDVEDCFYQTVNAFNLSERCQMPVIILSEQALGHRRQNFKKPNLSQIKVESRLKAEGVPGVEFSRFKKTDSGISQTSVPGMPGLQYTASGVEHDEAGELCYDPTNRAAMMDKRFRKLDAITDFTPFIERFGHVRADIGVIGWGSTAGPIKEAVFKAMQMGLKVSALQIKILSPLPVDILKDFLATTKNIIIPEENREGQLANLLRQQFDFKPLRFNKYDGLPFTASEILNRILDVSEICHQQI